MAISHDTLTHPAGVSHVWRDENGFAYVWHDDSSLDKCRGSLLMVGAVDTVAAGPLGWVMRNPQRVYVPTYGPNGPLILGATSDDPQTAWHGADEVAAVVRDLSEQPFTRLACLFQFEGARFLGNADGQYVLSNGDWAIPHDGDRVATVDAAAAGRAGFLPGETQEPYGPLSAEGVTAESLADEIRKVIQ